MLIERLRARVDRYTTPGPPDDCWAWTRSCLPGGRPRLGVRLEGRSFSMTAARIIVASEHGLDPFTVPRWVARHTCDNLSCVNPAHLEPGTYRQNTGDMWERGRGARGDRRPSAVLSEALVREIRERCAAGEPQAAVGAAVGVSQSHVSQVVRGVIWAWVE